MLFRSHVYRGILRRFSEDAPGPAGLRLPPDPAAPGPLTCWATTVPANTRCQALLARAGYERVADGAHPELLSFDAGDWVYRGPRLDRLAA